MSTKRTVHKPFVAIAYTTRRVGSGPYHVTCYNQAKRDGYPEVLPVETQHAHWPKGKACEVCGGKTTRVLKR